MRKLLRFIITTICLISLCACSQSTNIEDVDRWDCSVICAEESVDTYVITYSDEEIISKKGVLSFKNMNDFDVVVHLLADGEEERTAEISAGGAFILYQVKKGLVYTVGCHADVEENTEIKLMVYDGEGTD